MYDKIAKIMNESFGSSDMDSDLVFNYLVKGSTNLISDTEAMIMEILIKRYVN